MYTPLNLIVELFFEFFFKGTYVRLEIVHTGEKHSLTYTSRIQNIELVGYLEHKHNLKTRSRFDGKIYLSNSYSAGEKLTEY